MADLTQMGMSAPPLAVAAGTELGMGVPGMPPQLHHEHNGPQEQPHEHQAHEGLGQEQPQPIVGTEDVVKLFGFIISEFRGFLAHVEHAVQVQACVCLVGTSRAAYCIGSHRVQLLLLLLLLLLSREVAKRPDDCGGPLVQSFQTTGTVPSQPLYRVKADLLPAAKGSAGGHAGGPGPGRPRKVAIVQIAQCSCFTRFFPLACSPPR